MSHYVTEETNDYSHKDDSATFIIPVECAAAQQLTSLSKTDPVHLANGEARLGL